MSGSWVWVISTSTFAIASWPWRSISPAAARSTMSIAVSSSADVMAELRRAEHHVVAQVVGLGELRVVVGADRLPGQVGRDVEQADVGCAHGAHFIQAGVTGRPLWWRYSAIALRFFSSSRWPAPNMSQKSPTHTGRFGRRGLRVGVVVVERVVAVGPQHHRTGLVEHHLRVDDPHQVDHPQVLALVPRAVVVDGASPPGWPPCG